eukprot:SAG25_NODE_734_length_5654_cov_2.735734_8_plen_330_part_00
MRGFLRKEYDVVDSVGICLNGKKLTVRPTPGKISDFKWKEMCLMPWWQMRVEERSDEWVWCHVKDRRRLKLDEESLAHAVEQITNAQRRQSQHVQLVLTESAVSTDAIAKLDELLTTYKMAGRAYDADRIEILAVGKETKLVCEQVNALKKQDEPRSWMTVTGGDGRGGQYSAAFKTLADVYDYLDGVRRDNPYQDLQVFLLDMQRDPGTPAPADFESYRERYALRELIDSIPILTPVNEVKVYSHFFQDKRGKNIVEDERWLPERFAVRRSSGGTASEPRIRQRRVEVTPIGTHFAVRTVCALVVLQCMQVTAAHPLLCTGGEGRHQS